MADLKFTVNPTNTQSYKRVDFYLCNNIYNTLIGDTSKVDNDFKLVKLVNTNDTNATNDTNNKVCIKSLNNKGRKTYDKTYSIDNINMYFTYKDISIYVNTVMSDTLYHTINPIKSTQYRSIIFSFVSNDDMQIMNKFLDSVIEYTDIHMYENKCDIGKLVIYCNDDGYWENTLSKRYRNMDTIYLPEKDKSLIVNDVDWFLSDSTKERYASIGRVHKRVYLFEGLPGSGKTTFISAIASKIGYDIAIISFTEKVTDGTLIRLMKNIPEKTILVMEDIDVLFQDRKKHDNHKNLVTFSGILNNLDGITTRDGFICFITTNYKDCLDSALLRTGRIDKQLKFTYITKEQMRSMFIKFMGDMYIEDNFTSFYTKFKSLNIKVSVSLIQEYLFKYLETPDMAIENVDEIKTLYDLNTDKNANMWS